MRLWTPLLVLVLLAAPGAAWSGVEITGTLAPTGEWIAYRVHVTQQGPFEMSAGKSAESTDQSAGIFILGETYHVAAWPTTERYHSLARVVVRNESMGLHEDVDVPANPRPAPAGDMYSKRCRGNCLPVGPAAIVAYGIGDVATTYAFRLPAGTTIEAVNTGTSVERLRDDQLEGDQVAFTTSEHNGAAVRNAEGTVTIRHALFGNVPGHLVNPGGVTVEGPDGTVRQCPCTYVGKNGDPGTYTLRLEGLGANSFRARFVAADVDVP